MLRFEGVGCKIFPVLQPTHFFPEELMSNEPMMDVTSDDKLWAALAYVFSPLVPIIILLMPDKKDRPFIKAHNTQALVLGIITAVTAAFCVGLLVWFYQLYCAYQAYQGNLVEIPVISGMFKG
jgi:uncharacterized membrane protein